MDQSISDRYFFEAIFIEYMLIDDRLKSLGKLAGVSLTKPDGSPKMVGQIIDELKTAKKHQTSASWELLDVGLPLAPNSFLRSIRRENYPQEKVYISTHVPRHIVNFEISPKSGKYISKYGMQGSSLLEQIKKWVDNRNHWMHAAGNDSLTLEEYESFITPLAIDGNSFARELCAITNRIKRAQQKEHQPKYVTVHSSN